MNKELREAVAAAMAKAEGYGPGMADAFLDQADAAISIIRPAVLEEAASEIERKCRALPKSDRLRAYDFASVVRDMKGTK